MKNKFRQPSQVDCHSPGTARQGRCEERSDEEYREKPRTSKSLALPFAALRVTTLSPLRGKFLLALAMLILIALFVASGARPAIAQSGGGYDLTWNSIDVGGGMFSTGGAYSLGGTIGQADAGTMNGGVYTLNGGFWVDYLGNKLQLPLIVK